MENSLDWPPGQPVLPTSVRRAIGIAMMSCVSTGCTSNKQPSAQPNVPVIQIEQSKPANESPRENAFFTPQKALQATLSEPLQVVTTNSPFKGGLLLRNNLILMEAHKYSRYANDHDFHLPPSERVISEGVIVQIHSKKGEWVQIVAFAPPNKSISDTKKIKYAGFGVTYKNLKDITHGYKPSGTTEDYKKYLQDLLLQSSGKSKIPSCHFNLFGEADCERTPIPDPLQKACKEFIKNPGDDWRSILEILRNKGLL